MILQVPPNTRQIDHALDSHLAKVIRRPDAGEDKQLR
jgi:hypothetical protein